MPRRFLFTTLASGLLLGGIGCRHLCNKCRDGGPPPGTYLNEPVPGPRGDRIPPTPVPTTPGGPSEVVPPPVIPDSTRSFRIDPTTPPGPWDPAPTTSPFRSDLPPSSPPRSDLPLTSPAPTTPRTDNKELIFPDPLPGGAPSQVPSQSPGTRGFLEEPVRPLGGSDLPPSSAGTQPPAATQPKPGFLDDPTTRSPVGLPGFTRVPGRDGVASGRKPTLDGFDWLRANGFKTLVYLHAPSADVSAARDLSEKRGLRFVPIAVSPATLKKAFDEFAAVVSDRSARPLYVADEDGVRAGGLWYLLFRTSDLLGDDAARVRAAPLGLTDATTEEQKQFWLAIQDVLAKR